MGHLHVAFLLVLLAAAHVGQSSAASWDSSLDVATAGGISLDGDGGHKTCNGSVGQCMDGEEEEMSMESDIMRRVLIQRKDRYISYRALRKNAIPCGRRGKSYYDCYTHIRANPYRRPCLKITGCLRDMN